MKFLRGKDIYFKTFIVSTILSFALFVLTAAFFFFDLKEIPLGLLLGGIYDSAFFMLLSLLQKRKMPATIVILIVKFVLFVGIMVLDAYMYYSCGLKIFNLFALVGGYMLPTIIYIIFMGKEGKNGRTK